MGAVAPGKATAEQESDDETPVPITDVAPKVFRLMLRYVYGGDILAVEWITPKICLKPRTNMA